MTAPLSPVDYFDTTSGLPLDGAKVVITGSSFGFNNEYAANVPVWKAEFTMEDGQTQEQIFSTGGGEPSRDGSSINIEKRFSSQSNYGRIIGQARDLIGSNEEAYAVLGDVREAGGWIGTVWTLGIERVERTNPTTGQKKESFITNLVEFHGKVDEEDAPSKPATKTAAKKAPSKVKAVAKKAAVSLEAEDPELWAELVELASQYEDHDEFMEAAFELDSVSESKVAQNAVYKTGPGTVWAAAHGDDE